MSIQVSIQAVRSWVGALICLAATGGAPPTSAAPAAPAKATAPPTKVTGWLQERDSKLLGKSKVSCSDDACNYSFDSGVDTICPPRSPVVFTVNRVNKVFYAYRGGVNKNKNKDQKLKRLAQTFQFFGHPPVTPWTLYKSSTYAGAKADIWRASDKPIVPNAPASSFSGYEFYAAKEIVIPAPMAAYVSGAYGWPTVRALPLKVQYITPADKPMVMMDTISLKRTTLTPDLFQIPKDYKETDETAALSLGITRDNASSVIEQMLGDEKQKKKKKN